MFLYFFVQNIETSWENVELFFRGNRAVKLPIIILCPKYHSPIFNCLSLMLAFVVYGPNGIYCRKKRQRMISQSCQDIYLQYDFFK